MTGTITIKPQNQARRAKRRFDAVLTIEDPGLRNGLRFHRTPHPDHLVLKYEDIDFVDETIALPRIGHLQAAIDFGRAHAGFGPADPLPCRHRAVDRHGAGGHRRQARTGQGDGGGEGAAEDPA